jgi:hypothetical protein
MRDRKTTQYRYSIMWDKCDSINEQATLSALVLKLLDISIDEGIYLKIPKNYKKFFIKTAFIKE